MQSCIWPAILRLLFCALCVYIDAFPNVLSLSRFSCHFQVEVTAADEITVDPTVGGTSSISDGGVEGSQELIPGKGRDKV